MSSTGNVLAANTGTLKRYDPFGTQIGGTDVFGFGGSQLRETDVRFAVDFVQMGARVYIPVLGRFLQVDPVEGGTQNDYVYPNNPVNSSDFSGTISEGWLVENITRYSMGIIGLLAVGLVSTINRSAGDDLAISLNLYNFLNFRDFEQLNKSSNNDSTQVTNQSAVNSAPICNPSLQSCNNNPYRNQTKEQLIKSKKSLEKKIELHIEKIKNPQIDPMKIKGDPVKYTEGLVNRKWPNEIETFRKEIEKIDEILKFMQ